MSKNTTDNNLSLLDEEAVYEKHFDTIMEIAHFTQEKLHAEFHIHEAMVLLRQLEDEITLRDTNSRLNGNKNETN
jgi:hypothetical protein